MKLPLLFILTFILVLKCSECSIKDWIPNLFASVANKTLEITDYVRGKERSLENYAHNVQNEIESYFGKQADKGVDVLERITDKLTIAETKFRGYVDGALATGKNIFDTIAPEDDDHNNSGQQKCINGNLTNYYSTTQLIALHGYSLESHSVITDDGYILTVHRIPYSKKAINKIPNKKTVLFHHGLLGSSADWILAGPDKSLPYILSNAGYDVWLANVRGNTYSRNHLSLSVDSAEFWNFTFHEVSQHDLPAVIDYIMEVKDWDAEINYVGFSMGTTVLFGLLSTKTEYNKILKAGFALAPVAYMTNIKSPIKYLAKFSDSVDFMINLFGPKEILPQDAIPRWMSKHACEIKDFEQMLCENSMYILCGFDEKQFDKSLMPQILGHVPAGASTKTIMHYSQEIKNDGKFQQFDYGAEGNMKEYGTAIPPEYPVDKITLPIALFSAKNDWLASDKDASKLYAKLMNPIEHYVVPFEEFNHLDFLWAVDARTLVYEKVVELIKKILKNQMRILKRAVDSYAIRGTSAYTGVLDYTQEKYL